MKTVLIAIILLISCTGPLFAGEPAPKDFAYGMQLTTLDGEALYEVTIPVEVYRGVSRGDLGDICVFNGRNEIVPFAVSRPDDRPSGRTESVSLPMFPLLAEPGRKVDTLSLHVQKDKSGSIINVTAGNGNGTKRETVAYIIDASRLDRAVAGLELQLPATEEGLVRKISVQAGDDLENWSRIARDSALIRLRYGGHTLEKNTIELDNSTARYYRISARDGNGMPELQGISARLAPLASEPPRQWVSVRPSKTKKDAGFEYYFDSGGHMPVDRVRAALPQENTLVNASFFSRTSTDESWTPRGTALLYKVRLQGSDLENPDVTFPPVTDRYWLMKIDPAGGGLGQGTPALQFGWIPEKALFVARGIGPFTLAYGSSRIRNAGENGNALLMEFKNLRRENIIVKAAETGRQFVLGGSDALRPGLTPRDWKTAFLWAVLVAGVALLAWMAMRLYRQMK